MLFYDRSVGNHNFRPDPGLGMDHHVAAQNNSGADYRIVLNTAPFPDLGIVVDDAA